MWGTYRSFFVEGTASFGAKGLYERGLMFHESDPLSNY